MRYYISDLHFFHGNLNDRMDKRGFPNVEAMNQYIVDAWNARVKRGDEVVVLGDISLGKPAETNEILKRLKGRIFLIRGNHDKFLDSGETDLSRFEWVKDYAEMNDNGRKVVCCHYPICEYNGMFRRTPNGSPKTYMLFGHIHRTESNIYIEKYKEFVRSFPRAARSADPPMPAPIQMINCFCMFSNYVPLTLDEWIGLDNAGIALKSVQHDWKYDI